MLVGRRVLHDSGRVDSRFSRKCTFADIWRVSIGSPIEPFIELVRNLAELLERGVAHPDVEVRCEFRLEFQSRDDGNQVGIAATLAEPVECTLNLACSGSNRRK